MSFPLAGVKDVDLNALAQAIDAFAPASAGALGTLPPSQPLGPSDPFEALALAGGLSPAPPVQPVIGGGGFGGVAQGLLHAANNFLGVPLAQANQRLEAKRSQQAELRQAAAAAARESNVTRRQLAVEALKGTLVGQGKEPLAKNVDAILGISRDRGREAGYALGTALGIPRQDLEPILTHLPEVGQKTHDEETETLTIAGRQVEVPKKDLPDLLARLESMRNPRPSSAASGGMTPAQRRVTIDGIVARADQLARTETGVDDPYLGPNEKKAAQQRYPSVRVEHALALARAYVDEGLLDESALGSIRTAASTGGVASTANTPPPPPAGGGGGARHLSDQEITANVKASASRDVAVQQLNEVRNTLDGDSYRRARLAIDKAFPAGKAKR